MGEATSSWGLAEPKKKSSGAGKTEKKKAKKVNQTRLLWGGENAVRGGGEKGQKKKM